jgi:hypothetical protein
MSATGHQLEQVQELERHLPPVTYLDGTLLVVAGLPSSGCITAGRPSWPVLTTLVGWSALLLRLVRMFAPEARQLRRNAALDSVLLAMFAGGVVLTFKAYHPQAHQRYGTSTRLGRQIAWSGAYVYPRPGGPPWPAAPT